MTTHATRLLAVVLLIPLAEWGCGGLAGKQSGSRGYTTGAAGSNGSAIPGTPSTTGTAGNGAPSNTGDKYVPVGTNPFVVTAHDPLSTFAVDVDTASYDIFRRDVNLGVLPQPASVRLEEHVNNFYYAYPAPAATDAHPFRISLAAAGDMFHRGTTLLRVGVQAFDPPASEKKPANIVFLVDVSGSMGAADKLPLVQRVLTRTLDVLSPEDTVSIVTYSEQAQVRVAPLAVREKARIVPVINALTAGGSTAGAAALELAYSQARAALITGGINHILLCTDGDFNVGPSTPEALLALVKAQRQTGITLTVLGFGAGNLNDEMMEKVSNAGNGIYGMISSATQADSYVAERLLSTVVHVAQNMKVQVEFNPARVVSYRLLGYEDRAVADEDFRNDLVDGGEVGAGHRVTALYELVLTGQVLASFEGAPGVVDGVPTGVVPEVAPDDLALVKVRYQPAGASQDSAALEVRAGLPASARCADLTAADADLRWAGAVAGLAEILKHSPYADRALMPDIERIVVEQAAHDPDRMEYAQLFMRAKSLLAATP